MEKITLTPLEKRAFAKGLATERVRLKVGRMVWDGLEAIAPKSTLRSVDTTNRLIAFKEQVEKKLTYHEKAALKEWLEAQLTTEYEDMLGNAALHNQLGVYEMCLKAISVPEE